MSRESRGNAELAEAKQHIARLELALSDRTTYSVIVFTGAHKGANTTAQARPCPKALPESFLSCDLPPEQTRPRNEPALPPSQVYLNLMGIAGASGERPLLGSSPLLGSGPAFRRGGAAKFSVESHYLGHLTSMLVGHDNTGCARAGRRWLASTLPPSVSSSLSL